jgi:hypothetical protein
VCVGRHFTVPVQSWHSPRAPCNACAGTVAGMEVTARHREVEAGFRRLVAEAEIAAPDRVAYEPESVLFFWEVQKLCVAVDFDRPANPSNDMVGAPRPP